MLGCFTGGLRRGGTREGLVATRVPPSGSDRRCGRDFFQGGLARLLGGLAFGVFRTAQEETAESLAHGHWRAAVVTSLLNLDRLEVRPLGRWGGRGHLS